MQDKNITELFFSRCEDGITALDKKFGTYARALSVNILGSPEEAEECVNDAYLAFWNSVPPNKPDNVGAYLYKIVRNISISRYHKNTARKRNSSYALSLEELSEFIPSKDTVESEMELSVLTKEIESFLDTLSDENSAIFILRYWFGDSYRSISKKTGLKEKTVSVRLSRIRKELKHYLTEREVL